MVHYADTETTFGPREWALVTFIAFVGGSAFLFTAVGLESFPPAAVTTLRVACGALTLSVLPAARKSVPRQAWPAILVLGVVWIAFPLVLLPIAQQHINSSLAGMINGAVPLSSAAVAILLARRLPPANQRVGLLIGFAGVAGVALPTARSSPGVGLGVVLVLLAVLSYGIAFNLAAPLQRAHGALPVILRSQLVALVLVGPVGLPAVVTADPSPLGIAAVAALGCAGTGLVFAALTTLAGRVGATRGSIAIYFTPVVATLLGIVVRGERVLLMQVAAASLVVAGAWITSRARPNALEHTHPDGALPTPAAASKAQVR